jgi:putative ABC transport system permease protein
MRTAVVIAVQALVFERLRSAVAVCGVAFAVLLMTFMGSLLFGFVAAAGRVINSTGGDIWMASRGVSCFDCAAPMPSRYRDVVLGVDGVEAAGRAVSGFTVWRKPSGAATTIALIGIDANVVGKIPLAFDTGTGASPDNAVVIDRSNTAALAAISVPTDVEIGVTPRRARVARIADGFGSFFAAPYVFTSYANAHEYFGLPAELTHFVIMRVSSDANIDNVVRDLRARFPDVDVWPTAAFAQQTSAYWLTQTGAGTAILMSAVLGLIVGIVVVSQNMYATVVDRLDEFATLKALGASAGLVRRCVVLQALILGFIGSAVGLLMTVPAVRAARSAISWVETPVWLPVVVLMIGLAMSVVASTVAVRRAINADPASVFRA